MTFARHRAPARSAAIALIVRETGEARLTTVLDAALGKVFASQEYKDFLNARGFGMVYADAAGFGEHMAKADVSLGDAMKAAGLAKV